jgi:hypothetical protein
LTKIEEKDTITSTAQADPLIPEELLSLTSGAPSLRGRAALRIVLKAGIGDETYKDWIDERIRPPK